MGCLYKCAGRSEKMIVRRVVPIGKIPDEGNKSFTQALVGFYLFAHARGVPAGHVE
jgi:hypothetical protein